MIKIDIFLKFNFFVILGTQRLAGLRAFRVVSQIARLRIYHRNGHCRNYADSGSDDVGQDSEDGLHEVDGQERDDQHLRRSLGHRRGTQKSRCKEIVGCEDFLKIEKKI